HFNSLATLREATIKTNITPLLVNKGPSTFRTLPCLTPNHWRLTRLGHFRIADDFAAWNIKTATALPFDMFL
ncbi:unnamed protein product, partial [marine sediment metagenome]